MKKIIFYLLAFLPLSMFATNVETAHTWYLAGEAMEVSITDSDAIIAYAELCDTHGLAAGVAVSLKEGKGRGVLELPPYLHSGYYVLSVYNRHSTQVSQQLIAVVNPLHKSKDDDMEWVSVSHPDSLSYPQETSKFKVPLGRRTLATNGTQETSNLKPQTLIEKEGHIIMARVKNHHNGKTFSGSQIRASLSIIGMQIHYFEGQMVNDSTALFYTFDVYGKQPLVLSAVSTTGENLPIEVISPFATLLPTELPHLVFHYNRSEVEARSLDMQRHQKAITPAKSDTDTPESTPSPIEPLPYDDNAYGTKPDQSYNLDEYRQFFTVREVILEYVSCVKRATIDGVSQLIVRKEQEVYNSTIPTLVLIDGMPVSNVDRLLNYDARRVHYINIYPDQFTFGNSLYNGILSFVTRSGRLTNYPTEPGMQYLVYDFPK